MERLTITFLVDNTIEWFTPMPSGFTSELDVHLSEHPVHDLVTGASVVDLENYCCGAHGFSALIETKVKGSARSYLTLFDTGPDSRSLVRNINAMQVPISDIDRVILSHWHSDHSGGLLSFLKLRGPSNPPCVVDLHPDRPIARGAVRPSNEVARLPLDPTFELIEREGAKVEKHDKGHTVADGAIWISGKIPRVTDWETGYPNGVRWIMTPTVGFGKGEWVKDECIMDERYACIDVAGKGLVIFSACSHAGIVNVVKDAIANFSRPIYMIVGGLHLAGPGMDSRIRKTVEYLSQLNPRPTYILPMHCSGFKGQDCTSGSVQTRLCTRWCGNES